jgi:multidrug efflux pump subunit AcrA (membrane-fusion protein)
VVGSEQVAEALFVPYDAVRYVFGVYKVFTVEGSQLKEREVKIGDRDGEAVEVLEGVGESERVAVAAEGEELEDGAAFEAVR